MINPTLTAMSMRKKAIANFIRKGMIPALANSTQFMERGMTNIIINLTGAKESVYDILGHNVDNNGIEILQKVVKTSVDVAVDQGKHLGEDSIGIAMIYDDSAGRFASLDSDKYGRIPLLSTPQNTPAYSQGLTLNGKELLFSGGKHNSFLIEECISLEKLLNGGLSATLDVSNLSSNVEEVKNAIEAASDLQFFRPRLRPIICTSCGKKLKEQQSIEKCGFCRSPYLVPVYL